MSRILSETIDLLYERTPESLDRIEIVDAVVGLFFTGVTLSSGHAGVAATPAHEIPEAVCCPTSAARMPRAGQLAGKTVSEVIGYALDSNVLKAAIGVAALNAASQLVLEAPAGGYRVVEEVDGFDLLRIGSSETVSLVGAFVPYIRRLKAMGNPYYIIERNRAALRPDEMARFRSEKQMGAALRKSDAVIVTGTAVVNHSIDTILASTTEGQRVAIIGPTASMVPDAFFLRGVDVLAGIRITDPDMMIDILKQAGSAYHLLHQCSQRIALLTQEAFVQQGV